MLSVLSKGGLGVVNFKVKVDALKLASIISNCSNADCLFISLSIFSAPNYLLSDRSGVLFGITPPRVHNS